MEKLFAESDPVTEVKSVRVIFQMGHGDVFTMEFHGRAYLEHDGPGIEKSNGWQEFEETLTRAKIRGTGFIMDPKTLTIINLDHVSSGAGKIFDEKVKIEPPKVYPDA